MLIKNLFYFGGQPVEEYIDTFGYTEETVQDVIKTMYDNKSIKKTTVPGKCTGEFKVLKENLGDFLPKVMPGYDGSTTDLTYDQSVAVLIHTEDDETITGSEVFYNFVCSSSGEDAPEDENQSLYKKFTWEADKVDVFTRGNYIHTEVIDGEDLSAGTAELTYGVYAGASSTPKALVVYKNDKRVLPRYYTVSNDNADTGTITFKNNYTIEANDKITVCYETSETTLV